MIVLHESDFDLLVNKGFCDNTRAFTEYYEYKHIQGNMQKIAVRCGSNKNLAKTIQCKAVQPITNKHKELVDSLEHSTEDEDAILAEFADVGTIMKQGELSDYITDRWGNLRENPWTIRKE